MTLLLLLMLLVGGCATPQASLGPSWPGPAGWWVNMLCHDHELFAGVQGIYQPVYIRDERGKLQPVPCTDGKDSS